METNKSLPVTYRIEPLAEPVTVTVAVPGSKSYTNRALLIAALTEGPVRIRNPLHSDDTVAMMECLRTLGIAVSQEGADIIVAGDFRDVADGSYELNANLSGTTIRFMLALGCIVPGAKILHGNGHLNKRPIGGLVDALRAWGANIEYLEADGFPPLKVNPTVLKSSTINVDGSVSSMFVSALMMIAPRIGGARIEVSGEQVSKPYIDMTIDIMRRFGVDVRNEDYRYYEVGQGQAYVATEYTVEGDISSAGYFWAVAALTGSDITVAGVNPGSPQGDMQFLDILGSMGNEVIRGDDYIRVRGRGVSPQHVDMGGCPDQAQTLALLSAFAAGETTISGIHSLRVKETERVVALQRELHAMGIETQATDDSITIQGGSPHGAAIDTYGDHRMAMSFAVAGTKLPGMGIQNPSVVSKTFPGFWEKLQEIGVGVKTNIALIGMRGTGKTTVGKLLAQAYGREFIDLDQIIQEQQGASISEIVGQNGWEHFRRLEATALKEAVRRRDTVISTGGGVVTVPEEVAILRKHCIVVLLTGSVEDEVDRIGNDPDRPPLTSLHDLTTEMSQLQAERRAAYEAAADIMIETHGCGPEEVAKKIAYGLL